MKNKKDIIYLFFTIIFYIVSITIIYWIDRNEVDKKIEEQAALMCKQKDLSKTVKEGNKELSSNLKDADAPITSKKDASNSLKGIDALVGSAQEINLSN
jgi:hypothetical protein